MNNSFQIVTKKYIQSVQSDADLFCHYFGDFNLKDNYKNPLRHDNNAGAKFFYKNGELIFLDAGWTGDFPAKGFFTIWAYLKVLLQKSGFSLYYQICKDLNLFNEIPVKGLCAPEEEISKKEKVIEKFTFDSIPFTQEALDFWSLPDWKATPEFLNTFNILQVKNIFYKMGRFGEQLSFAYCLNKEDGIYQMYFPNEKDRTKRFRGNKMGGIHFQNPAISDTEDIILTKSGKDWFYLQVAGFEAACVLSENYAVKKPYTILFDNDEVGIKRAKTLVEKNGGRMITIQEEGCKDFADLCKKVGLKEATNQLKQLLK